MKVKIPHVVEKILETLTALQLQLLFVVMMGDVGSDTKAQHQQGTAFEYTEIPESCLDFVSNRVIENAIGVGGWSGQCTCPNGQSYWVGDHNNWCGSIACVNGDAGQCFWGNTNGKRRKVICHTAEGDDMSCKRKFTVTMTGNCLTGEYPDVPAVQYYKENKFIVAVKEHLQIKNDCI
eukprot:UN06918